jgi:hypothetical protein
MPTNNPALTAVRTGLQIAHPQRDCFPHLYVHNLLLKMNLKEWPPTLRPHGAYNHPFVLSTVAFAKMNMLLSVTGILSA